VAECVALRDIAEVIGAGMEMPVESIKADEAAEYFGWLEKLVTIDVSASSALTRQHLEWARLLTDLRKMDYTAA
jgi:hypothetical protein